MSTGLGGYAAESNPFQKLMEDASKIKGAQMEQLRKDFERMPVYMKNTFFCTGDQLEGRKLSLDERVERSQQLRNDGNASFQDEAFDEAADLYQQAFGLLTYVESTDPDWRKNGIRDEFLRVERPPAGHEASNAALVSCLLNIAAVSLRLGEHRTSIDACSDALNLDPSNAKALYRRALARFEAPWAGAVDFKTAVADAKAAVDHEPSNRQARQLLANIRGELNRQKEIDRASFGNAFAKSTATADAVDGEIHTTPILTPDPLGEVDGDAQARQAKRLAMEREANRRAAEHERQRLWRLVSEWRDAGRFQQAAELEDFLRSKEAAGEFEAPMMPPPGQETLPPRTKASEEVLDFKRPSATMLAQAAAMGVDLSDPAVVEELERLQQERLGAAQGDGGAIGGDRPNVMQPSPRKAASGPSEEAVDSEGDDSVFPEGLSPASPARKDKGLKRMLAQLHQLPARQLRSIIRDTEMRRAVPDNIIESLDDLDAADLRKLLSALLVQDSELIHKKQDTRSRYWYMSFTVAMGVMLWRMWATGMLGWLWESIMGSEVPDAGLGGGGDGGLGFNDDEEVGEL